MEVCYHSAKMYVCFLKESPIFHQLRGNQDPEEVKNYSSDCRMIGKDRGCTPSLTLVHPKKLTRVKASRVMP